MDNQTTTATEKKEWVRFDGTFNKEPYDITLFSGEKVMCCWPTDSHFFTLKHIRQRSFEMARVEYIRPTVIDIWK